MDKNKPNKYRLTECGNPIIDVDETIFDENEQRRCRKLIKLVKDWTVEKKAKDDVTWIDMNRNNIVYCYFESDRIVAIGTNDQVSIHKSRVEANKDRKVTFAVGCITREATTSRSDKRRKLNNEQHSENNGTGKIELSFVGFISSYNPTFIMAYGSSGAGNVVTICGKDMTLEPVNVDDWEMNTTDDVNNNLASIDPLEALKDIVAKDPPSRFIYVFDKDLTPQDDEEGFIKDNNIEHMIMTRLRLLKTITSNTTRSMSLEEHESLMPTYTIEHFTRDRFCMAFLCVVFAGVDVVDDWYVRAERNMLVRNMAKITTTSDRLKILSMNRIRFGPEECMQGRTIEDKVCDVMEERMREFMTLAHQTYGDEMTLPDPHHEIAVKCLDYVKEYVNFVPMYVGNDDDDDIICQKKGEEEE